MPRVLDTASQAPRALTMTSAAPWVPIRRAKLTP
jgi:hypothetical protein